MRIAKAVLAVGLLMVLVTVAAAYLASLDKHPKNPRYLVEVVR